MKVVPGSKIPQVKAGAELVFVSPESRILRYSLALSESITNYEAEYEALVVRLELAIPMGIQRLHVHGDSQLIINQIEEEYRVHKPELARYQKLDKKLKDQIPCLHFKRIERWQS